MGESEFRRPDIGVGPVDQPWATKAQSGCEGGMCEESGHSGPELPQPSFLPSFPLGMARPPTCQLSCLLAHHVIPARKRGGKHEPGLSHCILPSCPPSHQEGHREGAGDKEGQGPGSGDLLGLGMKTTKQGVLFGACTHTHACKDCSDLLRPQGTC